MPGHRFCNLVETHGAVGLPRAFLEASDGLARQHPRCVEETDETVFRGLAADHGVLSEEQMPVAQREQLALRVRGGFQKGQVPCHGFNALSSDRVWRGRTSEIRAKRAGTAK